MITGQDNLEENKSLLTSVISTVFSGADAQEAQKWCLELLSSSQPAGRQNTTIQGIAIILDSPPDARLNLIIGDSQ
jgi:hypothetical protein